MTWLVDPETRVPLPAMPKADNWPPKSLPIYADIDFEPRDPEPPDPDVRNDPIPEPVRNEPLPGDDAPEVETPEEAAARVWAEIEADPEAVAGINAGLADLDAGRRVAWKDGEPIPDADYPDPGYLTPEPTGGVGSE